MEDIPQNILQVQAAADRASQPYVRTISNSSNVTVGNITHWHVDTVSNTHDKSEAFVKFCKKEEHLFVETSAFFEAQEIVENKNVVFILGGSGDGKTALLKHLALDMNSKDYMPLEINRPDEIELNYSEGKNIFFVCDDPFGGPYLQPDLVSVWLKSSIQKYLESGCVKIAFASRKTIWADCYKCLGELQIFSNVVEATSARLSPEEKGKLLLKYIGAGVIPKEILAEITELDTPIAFPYCCKLVSCYSSGDRSSHRLLLTFKRPFVYLRKELLKIQETSPWKYAVLVLVMLNSGALPCDQFNRNDATSRQKEMVDCVLDSCGIENAQRPFGHLKKCAESLLGTYLNKGQNCHQECIYCFSHDSIYEAVSIVYGEDNISDFLTYSNREWVVTVARPENYQFNEMEAFVKIYNKQYPKLAEIFTKYVLSGSSSISKAFSSPCLTDKCFQIAWTQSIRRANRTEDFMKLQDCEGRCVLYCAANVAASEILRFLLANGAKCPPDDNPYYHPLVGASREGNLEELKLLLEETIPSDLVIQTALENGSYKGQWETVTHLFSVKTNVCKAVVGKALLEATVKGHLPLVSFFMNYKPSDDDIARSFLEACNRGHESLIRQWLCWKKDICKSKIDASFINAAKRGQIPVLEILLKLKPSSDAVEEAVLQATKSVQLHTVTFILKQFEVNVSQSLISAASSGSKDLTTYLLGYSPSETSVQSAFLQACRYDHLPIVNTLYDKKQSSCGKCLVAAVRKASEGNAKAVMEFLVTLKPPIQAFEEAFVGAATYGTINMAEYLLSLVEKQFGLSAGFNNTVMEKALHQAARKGQCKLVKFLLSKGVDINAVDENGESALQLAQKGWRTGVVSLLLYKGATKTTSN